MVRGNSADGPTLLVASTGGHLEELYRLKDSLAPASHGVEWVTFDAPQSRSLLEGETVHHVPYIAPRAYRAAVSSLTSARRIIRNGGYARVVSTGSGIAVPLLSMARAHRVPCHYVESAARSHAPSFTGRVVSRIPGVRLYTQYPGWSGPRWAYRGSIFDGFVAENPIKVRTRPASRVVVTLGTMRTYGFRRAVEHLVKVLPEVTTPDADVVWQVGVTELSGLEVGGRTFDTMPTHELRAAIADADLVVAHAGVGSALTALEAGRAPVLLPRLQAYDEHVDDHQTYIAEELSTRGLAVSRDPADLTAEDVVVAMSMAVEQISTPPPFELRA